MPSWIGVPIRPAGPLGTASTPVNDRGTLIQGGSVVTPRGLVRADVHLLGERIVAVGTDLAVRDARSVDATDLLVLPGLIDVHVHVREPGASEKEDWQTATRAALAGGVTTILDMPNNDPPTVSADRVRQKLALAAQGAACDYGVYLGATADNVGLAADLAGEIIGLKVYLGSTTGSLLTDDWSLLYRHLCATPAALPVVVHAEDEQCLRAFAGSSPVDHNRNRPPVCAELATAHVLAAARAARRGVHIAHVSTPAEVMAIAAARRQVPGLTCEVCPHHLFLTAEDALRLGGWGKVNPPLRPVPLVEGLWEALPLVDLVATDHAPHTAAQKQCGYPAAAAGFPGLESLLPLLLLAVREGRLTLPRLVELTAAAPARLFHLAGKGSVAPGYDADIVLLDPAGETVVRPERWQTKAKGTPFAAWSLPGRIVTLWRRGEICVDGGDLHMTAGSGRQVGPRTRR
jgi:dihydroorotase (multifunctional complex type)